VAQITTDSDFISVSPIIDVEQFASDATCSACIENYPVFETLNFCCPGWNPGAAGQAIKNAAECFLERLRPGSTPASSPPGARAGNLYSGLQLLRVSSREATLT
jgi:hypothetical protein